MAAAQVFCVVKTGVAKSKGFLTIILLLLFSSFSVETNENQEKEKQQFFDELHPLVDYFEYSSKQYVPMLVTDRTLWFKADAGVLTGASSSVNGQTITVWQDQEGGDNNGVQAVVHAGESGESSHIPGMPSYVYVGNDHFNFNPLLRFDRTANGNSGEAVEFATPSRNDQTVFVVFKNIIGFNSFNHWAQPPLYGNDISSPGNLANEGLPTNTNHADIAFTYTANNNLAVGGGFSGDFNLRGNLNLNNSGRSQGVIGVFSRNSTGNNSVEFFLYANGSPESSASSPFSTGNTGSGYPITTPIRIGKHNSNDSNANSNLDGDVAEVLTYDRVLTLAERHEVESYLAIKYGITLNGNQDQLGVHQGNENYNYIDSDGNPIWNTDANYKFDIAGLGADSGYNLNQKISKSINPNAIVAMAIDTDFSEGNLKVRASITDKEFLIWGNDAAGLNETTAEVPSPEATHRLPREWRVQKTGNSIDNVSVQVDLSSASHGGNVNTLYLMVDTDNDGDFTTGTIEYFPASSYTSDIAQFDDVSFEDNNVFAIATQAVVAVDPCDPASGNPDSDGDGLADVCDQDDDNDGILDVNECELSTATFSSTTTTTGNLTLPNSGGTANWNISNTGQTSIVSSGLSDNNELYFVYTGNSGWNLTSDFEITNVPAGANVQLRLDGFVDKTGGGFSTSFGARFSTYTISWVGGAGDAVVYDPRGDQIVGGQQNLANGNSFTQDAGNKSNGAWNNDLLEWYVVFPAGATEFTIHAQGGSGIEGFRFSAVEVFCDDFDKDGTPNYLDTDSDNDGCPDAIDGAGTFTLGQLDTDLEISGNINSTTGIPEDAGNGQEVGSAYNAGVTSNECDDDDDGVINGSDICNGYDDAIDTDGDTVPDGCDLDNDNDGILDTVEGCESKTANFEAIPFSTNPLEPGDTAVNLNTGVSGETLVTPITLAAPVLIGAAPVGSIGGQPGVDSNSVLRFETNPSPFGGGITSSMNFGISQIVEISASNAISPSNVNSADQFTFTVAGTVPAGFSWVIKSSSNASIVSNGASITVSGTSGVGSTPPFAEFVIVANMPIDGINLEYKTISPAGEGLNSGRFSFSFINCKDSDGDGTDDYLDSDSDNDGCPDALEGGGSFTLSDINGDNELNGTVNTTTGIPDAAGAGQTVGTAIDAAVTNGECDDDNDGVVNSVDKCNGFNDAIDTDGDTVPDGCDQDSDNDGILDADETFTGGLDFTGATGSGGSNVVVLDGENVGDICPSDIGYSIVSIMADSGQSFAGNDKGSLKSRFIGSNGPGVRNEFELRFTNPTKMVVTYVNDANKIVNGQFFTPTEGYEFSVPTGKTITLSDPDDQLLVFDGTAYVSGITSITGESIRFRLNTAVVGGSQLNIGAGTFSFKTEKIDVLNIKHINFATTGGGDNTQFNFAVEDADIDCDNDGTPNHLDLDSDADGCPDALEGAANFAKTDLVDFGINDRLNSAVELNTTSPNYGVPTISGSPQGIGTSIDAAVSSGCDIDLDLDKSVDNSSPREGETVTFTIQVNNASTTTAVTGVEIKDVIPVGLENILAISNGGALAANTITWANLTIPTSGLTLTYTADIKTATGVANEYKNIAQITASDIGDPDSTVNNDDGDQSEDDEDSVILTPMFPGIELTKTLAITTNEGGANLSVNDVVTYTFVAENTGNVILSNVSINDTFTDANGNVLTLGAITFDSATGTSTATTINVGESSTFTATYTITQSDVDAGGITNTAMVRADVPGGDIANPADDITDVSDDDDDTDGNTSDDPTVDDITQNPALTVLKTVTTAGAKLGDVIAYDILVTNSGDVTITNIVVTDTNADAGSITYSNTDDADSDNDIDSLAPGVSATVTVTQTITQAHVDAGLVVNSATATGKDPNNTDVTDTSDAGTNPDGTPVTTPEDEDTDGDASNGDDNDPTGTTLVQNPALTVLKTVSTAGAKLGDVITYDILVTNSGDVTVTNIAVTDANADAGSITYSNTDDADSDNDIDSLAPGASATVTVTQTITQAHVDAGLVVNSATATGKDPNNTDVTDTSDAGTNPDGTPVTTPEDEDTDGDASNGDDNDPTGTTLVQNPALTVLKTVSTAGAKLGDVIAYDILVTNSGDVTVTNIVVTDANADAGSITYSNTDDADSDNDIDSLAPGASATVTVTQTITQAHVDAGLVVNSATATGKDPNNTDVTDTSDAGTNPDGSPVTTPEDEDTDGDASNGDDNDPTGTTLVQNPALTVLKTVTTAGAKLGDVIGYDILVINSGDVTITNIAVTDANADAGSITYSNTDDADSDNDIDSLAPGASATVTVTQTITQAHVDAGLVVNSAMATGKDPNNTDVTDTSDAGTNPDGSPVTTPEDEDTDGDASNGDDNDPTGTTLVQNPALTVLKTVTTAGAKLGDVIGYDILVINSGDVTVTNIAVTDANADAGSITYSNTDDVDSDNDIDSLAPGASAIVTVTQTITQAHVDAGLVVNSAMATGKDPNNTDVTDTSDAGTNPDGTPVTTPEDEDTDGDASNGDDNDPTGTTLVQNPALTVLKTVTTAGAKLGDVIGYDILVTNSGDVTVTNIAVTDANADAGSITYSNTDDADSDNDIDSLAPGASATVTVTQTITQAHVDAGLVANSATATGKDPNNTDVTDTSDAGTNPDGTPVTTPEDEDTDGDASNGDDNDPTGTTLVQNPALTVLKTVTTAGAKLGDVIAYDILVTNSGDVTVTNIAVTDANADAGSITYSNTDDADSDNDIDSLAPGASATVTVTQTITQAHVDAGLVVNSAMATGKDPNNTDVTDISDAGTNPDGSPVTTPEDEDTDGDAGNGDDNDPTGTTLVQNPALTVLKTVTTAGTKLGDVIAYDILVTNSGDVTVTNIVVTDANADAGSITYSNTDDADSDNDIDSLAPGASATVTVTQTITQAHVDAGLVVNSATATGKDPNNTDVTDTSDAGTNPDGTPVTTPEDEDTDGDASNGDDNDPTGTTLSQNPALTVLKTVTTAGAKLGDVIAYDILVTNSGDVTVTNIAVTDANADAGSITYSNTDDVDSDNDIDSLAPGASATVTVTQTITQAHVDAGLVVNSAIATGKDPNNTDVTDTSDAGTNPDGTPVTTPEDEDTDGDVSNGDDDDPTGTTLVQNPALTVLKTVTTAGAKLGDVIGYDILVTNSGDVTVTNIAVTDANADAGSITYSNTDDADSDNDIDSLAPGASATVTVTQTITQAHVDAGLVVNSATATGKDPNNTDVTDTSDAGTNPDGTPVTTPGDEDTDGDASNGDDNDPTGTTLVQNPALTVEKRAAITDNAPLGVTGLGDEITYTITVENTGDVTLTNITLADSFTSGAGVGTLIPVLNPATQDASTLAVGATLTYTVSHTITQADVDAGSLSNTVTATGKDPNNNDVTDESDDDAGATDGPDPGTDTDDDPTVNPLDQNPAIALEKSFAFTSGTGNAVGDVIEYTFEVTNTGNVTVSNLTVTDAKLGLTNATVTPSTLVPGAVATLTANYTITQADLDAGLVVNSATATGKDPNNTDVIDTSDAGTNSDGSDVTTPENEDTDGDTSNGDDDDPTTTDLTQTPEITLEKSFSFTTGNGSAVGDVLTYSLVVTNTGNVTIDNVSITDAKLGLTNEVVTPSTLAPGVSATLIRAYTITQADLNAGEVVNTAVAEGTDPKGNNITDTSDAGTAPDGTDVTTPEDDDTDGDASNGDDDDPTISTLIQTPVLVLEKSFTFTSGTGNAVGDVIEYTFEVTNTGNVTVDNISITDAKLGMTDVAVTPSTLNPGESTTLTANYTVTQADLDAGEVVNTAVAEGEDPKGNDVSDISDAGTNSDGSDVTNPEDEDTDGDTSNGDDDDPTTTDLTQNPSIILEKSFAFTNGIGDTVGDEITYTFEVTNTGNVTVNNLTVTDAKLGLTNAAVSPSSIAPGATATLRATYAITQADLDAGEVVNTAVAEGEDPKGNDVSDTSDAGTNSDGSDVTNPEDEDTDGDASNGDDDDDTISDLIQDPAITVVKTIVDADTQVGGEVTYRITVTNTGNITVNTVRVTDAMLGLTNEDLTPSTLAPGESAFIESVYTITQADMDRGYVENTASGSAVGVNGDAVNDISDTDIDGDGNGIGNHEEVDSPDGEGNTDGDSGNDVTVLALEQIPEITLTKKAEYVDVDDNLYVSVGDEIRYTFHVTNSGNVTLTNVTVEDAMLVSPYGEITGGPIASLMVGETDTTTFTGVYQIQQSDIDRGWVSNTAKASGFDAAGVVEVNDVSDTGTKNNGDDIDDPAGEDTPDQDGNTDGDTGNDPTIIVFNKDTCLTIYNEFSPNDDMVNDFFEIDCIESYPGNTLEIFNRWGNTVYKTKDYDNSWDGTSNGRATVNGSDKLPVGTYYYVLDLNDGSKPRTGWLYLNR